MNKLPIIVVSLLLVLSFGLAACGDDDGETGSTVSGTLTKSGVPDGTKAYLKLVAHGSDSSAAALYFVASSDFSGGTATYSLSGVEDGSYTGWAFIDMNGNAPGDSSSMPDEGDYATAQGGEITVAGDVTSNIGEEAWTQL